MSETSAALGNFIPDANRWNLPTPPPWFLQGLFDFDPALVLIPSRKKVEQERPAYLLCRRRTVSAGFGDVAMLDNKHPDTNLCYKHGVLPIGPLRFKNNQVNFTLQGLTSLLDDLRSRDLWAVSGGADRDSDRIWKEVEYAEQRTEQKAATSLREKFFHMGRDAWRSLQARTGQRNKRASSHHGVARATPHTGQRVVLTDAQ